MTQNSANPDYIALMIGQRGRLNPKALRRAIESTQKIVETVSPMTAIDIAIAGYDDDPREIWEIREARRFIIDYALGLQAVGIPLDRLLKLSQQLVTLCLAAHQGYEIIKSDDDVTAVIDVAKELTEYRARIRSKMN